MFLQFPPYMSSFITSVLTLDNKSFTFLNAQHASARASYTNYKVICCPIMLLTRESVFKMT